MVAILTDIGLIVVFILSVAFLIVAFLIRKNNKVTAITISIIVAAAAVAQLYLALFNSIYIGGKEQLPTGLQMVEGVVEETRGNVHGTTVVTIKTTQSDAIPNGRLISINDCPEEIMEGQIISCNIIVNDTGVADLDYYIDGIFISAVYSDGLGIISQGNGIGYYFSSLQTSLTQRVLPYLTPENSGVAAAITYGDRTGLPYEIVLDFSKAGLSHVLVVSGLHLSILCGILLFLLRRVTKNRYIIYPVLILTVILYTLLCGVRLSIVRAAFVVVMLSVSKLISKRADSYTSLGLAILVVTLLNPYSAIDLSLLLSLFATVGILYANEAYFISLFTLKKKNRYLYALISAAVTSIAAIIATMPVFAALGGGFSLLAIPANIVIVLLTTPIIATVLLGIVTTFLPLTQFSAFIFKIAEVLIDALTGIARFVANIEWQFINFNGDYPFIVLLIAFSVGFLLSLVYRPQQVILGGAIIVAVGIISYYILDYNMLHVAVVGETQNPVIVITKNSDAAVIYRGTKSNNDEVERYLSKLNIRKIDYIVDISHSDSSLSLTSENIYVFEEQDLFSTELTIMDNVTITLRKQPNSNVSLLDIAGFNVAMASGEVDFSSYGRQDLVVAGSSKQHNIETVMLFTRKPTAGIDYKADVVLPFEDIVTFKIKPDRSYVIEV